MKISRVSVSARTVYFDAAGLALCTSAQGIHPGCQTHKQVQEGFAKLNCKFAGQGRVERMAETVQIAAITGNISNGEIFLTRVNIAVRTGGSR